MQKLMNDPNNFVDEMLDGFVDANPHLCRDGENLRVIRAVTPLRPGKVGIVTGGGSGHLPLFTGYVGKGLLDACAVGDVFEGPSVGSCMRAIQTANSGKGVLRLYGNYGGDRMNFDMAGELLEGKIDTTSVLGCDDIASAGPAEATKRRGVAGIVYAYKAAGAAADEGRSLEEVTTVAQKVIRRTRTIGLALSGCKVPGAGKPSFEIAAGEIEMGLGIHGEPGLWRDRMKPADDLVDEMLDRLLADKPDEAGDTVSIIVNSLGATSQEELFILYRRASAELRRRGYRVVSSLVGRYVTSMEMAGASISLCFADDELHKLLAAPASCPFWQVTR
ncbi:dihydroxyacetone kinase subunit DhaK [Rhizobium sp. P32RR-XVIII]|uniref:dihydroxyacetone kinase subunit DhaK n=1 Tax=Rhizobium sp. P32RR-XVIII TaxID=2726738 RepID=UPI0014571BE7|nr:dihydroxyacetone kinase subunit DhaK [Rhizobium sp. P32RR-XVIII]NLS07345.1 dihydroxyacetone kinase subunit DhaK [Rhizobium sp. P32RR-XVIII]